MKSPLKICGLTTPEDARLCAEAGAAALGAVFYPPSPRNVSPERAAEVFADVPPDVARVGVFVDATAADILRAARIVGVNSRDLRTFRTDPEATYGLLARIPADRVRVAESGVRTNAEIRLAATAGADAVLVGEAVMRAADPATALKELLA